MGDINQFILAGRCSQTPELRNSNDREYCFLKIATNKYDKKTQKETPTFITTIVGGKLAAIVCDRVTKGDSIVIEGVVTIKPGNKDKGTYESISLNANNVIFPSGGGKPRQDEGEEDEGPL